MMNSRQSSTAHRTIKKGNRSAKHETTEIPKNCKDAELEVDGGPVRLTNLQKIFWPGLGLTKRDLLQYYVDVSSWLLPHLRDRAMVMKRYPNESPGSFFFRNAARPREP